MKLRHAAPANFQRAFYAHQMSGDTVKHGWKILYNMPSRERDL